MLFSITTIPLIFYQFQLKIWLTYVYRSKNVYLVTAFCYQKHNCIQKDSFVQDFIIWYLDSLVLNMTRDHSLHLATFSTGTRRFQDRIVQILYFLALIILFRSGLHDGDTFRQCTFNFELRRTINSREYLWTCRLNRSLSDQFPPWLHSFFANTADSVESCCAPAHIPDISISVKIASVPTCSTDFYLI